MCRNAYIQGFLLPILLYLKPRQKPCPENFFDRRCLAFFGKVCEPAHPLRSQRFGVRTIYFIEQLSLAAEVVAYQGGVHARMRGDFANRYIAESLLGEQLLRRFENSVL